MTTLLIIPGLREHVPDHWQTHLAARRANCRTVEPAVSDKLSLAVRLRAIDFALEAIDGPVIVVAHSAGVAMFIHWVSVRVRPIDAALLITPPDLRVELPKLYPSLDQLTVNGWLPVPRQRLPFPSIVGASDNDHLASFSAVQSMAEDWGSTLHRLGSVGHMNPASGYGNWLGVDELIVQLQEKIGSRDAAA